MYRYINMDVCVGIGTKFKILALRLGRVSVPFSWRSFHEFLDNEPVFSVNGLGGPITFFALAHLGTDRKQFLGLKSRTFIRGQPKYGSCNP